MAQKKITDLQLRSDFDETCNVPLDDAVQTWRTTGQQMLDFFKEEIAPITSLGDLVFGDTGGTPARLAGNTEAVEKMLTQTGTGSVSAAPTWREVKAPTIQKFTSGSGTYTKPANVLYLRVRMVGGGGGGGGSGTVNGTIGGTGGTTTFGSSLLTANGGTGGKLDVIGAGGTASLGAAVGTALTGGSGSAGGGSQLSTFQVGGGAGGNSAFGGGGGGGLPGGAGTATGVDGATNTGGGGGGAGGNNGVGSAFSGNGGGAGGFVDAIITSPSSTYAYAVGAGGTAGTAGTSGTAGGAGGSGYIEVTEYYQ